MFETANKINVHANKHIKDLPSVVRLPLKLIIFLTVFGLALIGIFFVGMFSKSSEKLTDDINSNPMEKYVSTDIKYVNDPTNIFWND